MTTQDPEPGRRPGLGSGAAGVRDEMGRTHADPLDGIPPADQALRRTGGGGRASAPRASPPHSHIE
jgi:hypothetical protein